MYGREAKIRQTEYDPYCYCMWNINAKVKYINFYFKHSHEQNSKDHYHHVYS